MPKLNPSADDRTRYDETSGAVRSFFDPELVEAPATIFNSIAAVSDEFLAANAGQFDLEGIDLILAEEKEGSTQITCKYEQFHQNIPVYGAYVNVTLRKPDRQIVSAVNKINYRVRELGGQIKAVVSSDEAVGYVLDKYGRLFQDITHSEPELMIYKNILVWRIDIDTGKPKINLELLIHATDCGFVEVFDRRRYYASRNAKVFWPDPVTSSQNKTLHWGSPDSDLNRELAVVTLENLDDPTGAIYRLVGKWVKIKELEAPSMKGPATRTDFNYSAKDRRFLSVMAYYFLDRLIEWLRSLDIPAFNGSMMIPIDVDAQALDQEDNSHFVVPVSGAPYIAFGEGGTPDASDPGVIVHEFGHALHYFLLGRSLPAGSFEEGFNDFLSCLFRDRFNVHGFDRANPFPWDNNPTVEWDSGRRCDMDLRFDDPGYKGYGLYKKGTVYATALWEIYLAIGGNSENPEERLKAAGEITATCMDMLIAVGDTDPIGDLANGLISSDNCRTGGKHEKVIRAAFQNRGLWR